VLTRITDNSGFVHAELTWQDKRLVSVMVRASSDNAITVVGDIENHPLLGPSHRVEVSHGEATHVSAIDWHAPSTIPAIFSPGVLPGHTGTMLLNVIATLARDAGVGALRYCGPYPTVALYNSLTQCFSAHGTVDQFASDEWLNTALLGKEHNPPMISNEVSFVPDPFVRQWITPKICTQHRRQLERATIHGVTFSLGSDSLRLVHTGTVAAAQVWFGDVCWATIAELDTSSTAAGALQAVHQVPELDAQIVQHTVGKRLPPALLAGLADLIAADVAPPLQSAVAALVNAATIRWAHAGVHAVRVVDDVIEIHAALWQCLAPRGMTYVLAALVAALAPVFMMQLQRTLQQQWKHPC
jgi:hypothetical protein